MAMDATNPHVQRLSFQPGQVIFAQGEIGYDFYIVESGTVSIAANNVEIAKAETGESFGEFALLDKQPRSASAIALTACQVVKVSKDGYQQMLSELPTWAVSMLEAFARRIKTSNEILKKIPQFLPRN